MQLKKVLGPIVAIVVVLILASAFLSGRKGTDTNGEQIENPGPPNSPGTDDDSEPNGSVTDNQTSGTPQPNRDEDGCIEILPGISREYEIIRVEGNVNGTISLDALEIFGITAENYLWAQKFAQMNDLQYMSNHKMTIMGRENSTAYVNVTYPGVYRVELIADGYTYEMELRATKIGRTLELKGLNFIDLFGTTGNPEFNIHPDDPLCFEKALEHAFEGPLRVGAEWVGLVPAAFYYQVDPPLVQDNDTFLSMSDDVFYEAFINAAHDLGLKVMETHQVTGGLDFTEDDWRLLSEKEKDPDWWGLWFDMWEKYTIMRATRAEIYGMDAIILDMYAETTLNPDVYPEYAERWTELIHAVREVYSGQIGLNFINADERLTFYEELDFIQITYFGGLYTFREDAIANVQNPTMEEIMAINDMMFEGMRYMLGGKIPIYVLLTVGSSDGQNTAEDPALRTATDFNEQVIYYEAFFASLEKYDWATGIMTERWDFWDEYRRFGEDYNIQYFDETNSASPRNKPAEDVVALWFEVYQSP